MRLQADCLSDARFTKIEGNAPAFPERRAVSHVHDHGGAYALEKAGGIRRRMPCGPAGRGLRGLCRLAAVGG